VADADALPRGNAAPSDVFAARNDEGLRAGVDSGQLTLLPQCLDDWIDNSNPVGVIDAFVDALDHGALEFKLRGGNRPTFNHPSILLSFTFIAVSIGFSRAGGSNAKPRAILG
jgi:hypothetical protein